MSWESTLLSTVETAIDNLAAGGFVRSYTIAGRSFTRESINELIKLRSELKKIVDAESEPSAFILAELNGPASSYQRFS